LSTISIRKPHPREAYSRTTEDDSFGRGKVVRVTAFQIYVAFPQHVLQIKDTLFCVKPSIVKQKEHSTSTPRITLRQGLKDIKS